jgi:hemerythrin-like domain-containing protein
MYNILGRNGEDVMRSGYPVAAVLVTGWAVLAFAAPVGTVASEIRVSPTEDLMREHGVLRRILLIYEKVLIDSESANASMPYDTLHKAALIVQDFIENYHEKLEEDYIFPKFGKSPLVKTLLAQHQAGRKLTADILRITNAGSSGNARTGNLRADMQAFVSMYRPHAAWEDTVLFPALHGIMSEKEYNEMGDRFEDKEHELFGRDGFEGIVKQVSALEKKLEIGDLARFTPNSPK